MNIPNRLTIARIVMIPIFVALVFLEVDVLGYFNDYLAFLVFAAASFTDYLDGHLARKWNMITDFGKLFDTAADKLLCGSALILLIYIFAVASPLGTMFKGSVALAFNICIAVIAVVMVSREVFVMALKSFKSSSGKAVSADMPGKIKAVLQMVGIMIILLVPDTRLFSVLAAQIIFYIGFACLAVAMVMAIISCVLYCRKYSDVFKNA